MENWLSATDPMRIQLRKEYQLKFADGTIKTGEWSAFYKNWMDINGECFQPQPTHYLP